MIDNLTGKTIIITGASTGVGEATARLCVAEGANVVIAARSGAAIELVAKSLGKQAVAVVADVARADDCQKLIDSAIAHFGRIDGLVNNAGFNSRGSVEAAPAQDLDQVVDVNLKAPIRLCKMALPHLKANPQASIVNVASLAGRVPVAHEATYTASKFGLRAFSFAFAEELEGTGVTVSVVSPGPIDTGFIMANIDIVADLVFSQPVSTATEVAETIIAGLKDGKRERVMNVMSGVLTTLGYIMPSMRAVLKPRLEAKGRRVKARYKAAQTRQNQD